MNYQTRGAAKTSRTTHSIDLSGFASGVYTLRIQSAKGMSGIKLVKE